MAGRENSPESETSHGRLPAFTSTMIVALYNPWGDYFAARQSRMPVAPGRSQALPSSESMCTSSL